MGQATPRRQQQYTLTARLIARLNEKIDRSGPLPVERPELGPCWLWGGSTTLNGYAQLHVRLDDGRWSVTVAHRVSYEATIGPIPDGKVLDHLCRNRPCTRPDHLEPVSDQVNILRGNGWSGRHARKTSCPAGHPYNDQNTHVDKNGMRHCRVCDADRHRAARRARQT